MLNSRLKAKSGLLGLGLRVDKAIGHGMLGSGCRVNSTIHLETIAIWARGCNTGIQRRRPKTNIPETVVTGRM